MLDHGDEGLLLTSEVLKVHRPGQKVRTSLMRSPPHCYKSLSMESLLKLRKFMKIVWKAAKNPSDSMLILRRDIESENTKKNKVVQRKSGIWKASDFGKAIMIVFFVYVAELAFWIMNLSFFHLTTWTLTLWSHRGLKKSEHGGRHGRKRFYEPTATTPSA